MLRVRPAGFAVLAIAALGGCALLAGLPNVHRTSTGGTGGAGGATGASSSTSASGGSGGGGALASGGASSSSGSGGSAGAGGCVSDYAAVVMADAPLGYWRLGDMTGTTAVATAGPDGMYLHAPSLGAAGALLCSADTAIGLDGVAATVSLGGGWTFAGRTPFSAEAWISPGVIRDPTVNHSRIFNWEAPDAGSKKQGWDFVFGTDGVLFRRYQAGVSDDSLGTAPPLGVWSHVVATFDGVFETVYQNGGQTSSIASLKAITDPTTVLIIGAQVTTGSSANMKGSVDEVAIYDHALSPARVLAHYQAGIAP